MKIPHLTLAQRILLAWVFVVMVSIIATAYVFYSTQQLNQRSLAVERNTEVRRAAFELQIEMLRIIILLDQYLETGDEQKLKELGKARASAAADRAKLRMLTNQADVITALDRYETLLPQRLKVADDLVATRQAAVGGARLTALAQVRENLDAEAMQLLRNIINSEIRAAHVSLSESAKYRQTFLRNLVAGGVLVNISLIFILFSVITGRITKRLSALTQMAQQIAVGDYSQRTFIAGDDEIGLLAKTFNEMAGQLAELDKIKEEFVALASHQLRTPATAVKGNLGMLLEGYHGELTAEQRETVSDAYQSNERQLAIIEDMLWVARTEAGRLILTPTPTDLAKLISDAVAEQKHVISARDQRLTVEKLPHPVQLQVDVQKMRMVIENLLSNASKYTPEGGKIDVLLRPGRADPEREVAISISDSGVGIEAGDMSRLFRKFSRIENPLSETAGGTGLGLFLANEIVKLHGGTIHVNSTLGVGTTFTVVLSK